MKRSVLVCLGAIVLLAACDGTQARSFPTGPTRTTGSNPPLPPVPPSTATFTVSGVVRTSSGIPLSGARVVVLGQAGSISTTTDRNGDYSVSGVQASFDQLSPLLSASSAGYFTDVEFADASLPSVKDTKLDFRLAPVAPISLGEVIQGRSPVGDRVCSHWGYGASACQRFALTAPVSGMLEVNVSATPFSFDVDIVAPDGTFALYDGSWRSPLRLTIGVEAGSIYEIRVIGGWDPARIFELTTRMQ